MSTTKHPSHNRDLSAALGSALLIQRATETSAEIRARLTDVARDLRLAASREQEADHLLELAGVFERYAMKSAQP
jgi:hypothetical protein